MDLLTSLYFIVAIPALLLTPILTKTLRKTIIKNLSEKMNSIYQIPPFEIPKEHFEKILKSIKKPLLKQQISHYYSKTSSKGVYRARNSKLFFKRDTEDKQIYTILKNIGLYSEVEKPIPKLTQYDKMLISSYFRYINIKSDIDYVTFCRCLLDFKQSVDINPKRNQKLLILRTYGQRKKENIIFDIAKLWVSNFGTAFTITDPTFANIELKNTNISSKGRLIRSEARSCGVQGILTLIALIATLVFLFKLFTDTFSLDLDFSGWAIGWFAGLIWLLFLYVLFPIMAGIFFSEWYASSRGKALTKEFFINNPFTLKDELFKEKTLHNNTFNFNFHSLYCYDNTWKFSLDELLSECNHVLLDLRGYNEKNVGTTYELNSILKNRMALKTIIVIDENTDEKYLRRSIASSVMDLDDEFEQQVSNERVLNIYQVNSEIESVDEAKNIVYLLKNQKSCLQNELA